MLGYSMNRQKLLSITLCTAIFLSACGQSKLSRVIAALDAAPLVISRFNLSEGDGARLKDGFHLAASKLRDYQADQSQDKWEIVKSTFLELEARHVFRVSNKEAQVWIDDVVSVVHLLLGLRSGSQRMAGVAPNQDLSEENLRALEQLMK